MICKNKIEQRIETKRKKMHRKKEQQQEMLVFGRVTCVVGEDRTEWTDAHVDQVA